MLHCERNSDLEILRHCLLTAERVFPKLSKMRDSLEEGSFKNKHPEMFVELSQLKKSVGFLSKQYLDDFLLSYLDTHFYTYQKEIHFFTLTSWCATLEFLIFWNPEVLQWDFQFLFASNEQSSWVQVFPEEVEGD